MTIEQMYNQIAKERDALKAQRDDALINWRHLENVAEDFKQHKYSCSAGMAALKLENERLINDINKISCPTENQKLRERVAELVDVLDDIDADCGGNVNRQHSWTDDKFDRAMDSIHIRIERVLAQDDEAAKK